MPKKLTNYNYNELLLSTNWHKPALTSNIYEAIEVFNKYLLLFRFLGNFLYVINHSEEEEFKTLIMSFPTVTESESEGCPKPTLTFTFGNETRTK